MCVNYICRLVEWERRVGWRKGWVRGWEKRVEGCSRLTTTALSFRGLIDIRKRPSLLTCLAPKNTFWCKTFSYIHIHIYILIYVKTLARSTSCRNINAFHYPSTRRKRCYVSLELSLFERDWKWNRKINFLDEMLKLRDIFRFY